MDNIANICLVGSGNMAFQLAHSFEASGLKVVEIYARKKSEAKKLAKSVKHKVEIHDSLDLTDSIADMIVICVSDNSIEKVASSIKTHQQVTVVHSSGSTDINSLAPIQGTSRFGVFYPLQSISTGRLVDLGSVPILIEASDYSTRSRLLQVARHLSTVVKYADSEQRRKIHLAAVLANNFTNYLLGHAFEQIENAELEPELLEPLIRETIDKLFENGPELSQTGPARRGDQATIQKHLDMLSANEQAKELYALFSQMIGDQFKK